MSCHKIIIEQKSNRLGTPIYVSGQNRDVDMDFNFLYCFILFFNTAFDKFVYLTKI